MDLKELLTKQIEQGCSMIYFVLKKGNNECLQRHKHDELESLIKTLKSYKYLDTKIGIPRFEEKARRNVVKNT